MTGRVLQGSSKHWNGLAVELKRPDMRWNRAEENCDGNALNQAAK